ncbi:mercuric ion transport protein [Albidovulum inexpectatum]|uniref:Mercuric ion transport protein n=1 Tax=Albidovulum inexpectatum TaxID=196587 RepID=A0A2S5JHW7_9RHOB|nr:hypothetical protein [Albidovulum inexpectatum]PPB80961.1 mercuric ion transport protein [Albidovulum inexpectatum]
MTSIRASVIAALAALGVSSCCVLPLALLWLGVGGAWVGAVGRASAFALPILTVSTSLFALAWGLAIRRGAARRHRTGLAAGGLLLAAAWLIYANETRINDLLISWM